MNNQEHKVYFIEVLRGLSALLVVAYHVAGILMGAYSFWPSMGGDLFKNGNIGVDIFFMISGFIICYATQIKESNHLSNYAIRRFFRIYPLFFICLTFAWLTYNSGYKFSQYLFSATLLQNDYAGRAPFFGYNMLYPAWTIAYEVIFYFIFFIGMWLNHKYRAIITSLLIISTMCLIQMAYKGHISLSGEFSSYSVSMGIFTPLLTLLGSPMMVEFIFGMFCYHIYSKISAAKNKLVSFTFIIASLVSISMLYFADIKMHGITEKGAVAAAIFISLMMAEISGCKLSSKITKFLSNISYSLYLTHAIILKFYIKFLKEIGLSDYPKGMVSFLFIFLVCIAVAYVAHITIEKWFISAGKKIIIAIAHKKNNLHTDRKPT